MPSITSRPPNAKSEAYLGQLHRSLATHGRQRIKTRIRSGAWSVPSGPLRIGVSESNAVISDYDIQTENDPFAYRHRLEASGAIVLGLAPGRRPPETWDY